MRRRLALLAPLVATLTAAGALAPATAAAPRPAATQVKNVNQALRWADAFTGSFVPARRVAEHRALQRRMSEPGVLSFSALRNRAFTLTFGSDQACVDWSAATGTRTVFRPGACEPGQQLHSKVGPRMQAARSLRAMVRSIEAEDPGAAPAILTREGMPLVRAGAPAGVRITGVTDRNKDGLDDDARVAFRSGGQAVCVELPLFGSRFRIHQRPCRELPARDVSRIARELEQSFRASALQKTGTQVAKSFAAASAVSNLAVADLDDATIEAVLDDARRDATVERTGPAVFRLTKAGARCSVTVDFTGLGVGESPREIDCK